MLYINGELAAVDSIAFVPHNESRSMLLPSYPMTIAVMAKDNFDPKTGMEYANTNIGDAGFILKFGDGTVTDGSWKAKKISWGRCNGDTKNPRVESIPVPENGFAVILSTTSTWTKAKEYTEAVSDPSNLTSKTTSKVPSLFGSEDIALDNVVLFRHVVKSPPDGKERADFRNLNNVVPDNPPRGRGPRN